MTHALRAGLLSVSSIVALGASAGLAAAQAPASEPPALDEIIVTAQRVAESLQDVPVSVTALTGERLAQMQINDLSSLSATVPSIKIKMAGGGALDLNMSMRGVRNTGGIVNIDSTVGVYVDGVYFARTIGANVAFVDMERVEVLRGPQGTLFGRNTIGGALNITTKEPTNAFEGSVKIGYGNYNDIAATGVLNVPLSDTLAVRLVYDHHQHDGYVKSVVPVRRGSDEFSDLNQEYYRGTLKWTPTSKFSTQLMVDHLDVDQNSFANSISFFDTTAGLAATSLSKPTNTLTDAARARLFTAISGGPVVINDWKNSAEYNPRNRGKATMAALTGRLDLGFGVLTSITGYRKIDFNLPQDADGFPVTISEIQAYALKGDAVSQELQLAGKSFDDKLSWIAGLYYFREENDQIATSYVAPSTGPLTSIFDPSGNLIPGTTTASQGLQDAVSKSKSAYVQLTYEVLENVRVTGGVRYVKDDRSNTYIAFASDLTGARLNCGNLQAGNLATLAGGCLYTPAAVHFDYTPWTLGLDYKPDEDTLIYAKVSKGFRSGGLQGCCGNQVFAYTPFAPESVLSYELGAKLTRFDRRLQLNAALYYSNYNDIQQSVPLANPVDNRTVQLNQNVGKATIKGAEFEATALIGSLRVGASLGLTDGEFTEGPFKGLLYPGNAKTSWSLSADYPMETEWGSVNLHADYNWQGDSYLQTPVYTSVPAGSPFLDVLSPAQKASLAEPSAGILNAVASFTFDTERPVTLAVWGRNLTNEFTGSVTSNAVGVVNFYGVIRAINPRIYGASVQVRF